MKSYKINSRLCVKFLKIENDTKNSFDKSKIRVYCVITTKKYRSNNKEMINWQRYQTWQSFQDYQSLPYQELSIISLMYQKPKRQRVQEAMDALGYSPLQAARQMRGSGSGNVAVVVPTITNNPFCSSG